MQSIHSSNGINPFNFVVPVTSNEKSEDEKKLQLLLENLLSHNSEQKVEAVSLIKDILNLVNSSSEIEKTETLLNQLSHLDKVLNSSAFNFTPDSQRKSQVGATVINLIESGALSTTTQFAKADDPVPPVGVKKYSAEERERRLQSIVSLKISGQEEKIGPGYSLMLNLIADELRESYMALQRNKAFQNQYGKAVLNSYKGNIESLIGLLSIAALTLGKFQGALKVRNNEITCERVQKGFVETRKSFLSDEGILINVDYNIAKILTNTSEGKRSLNALNLLEDFVTQEMQCLFRPNTDSLDSIENFSRLYRRANCFLRVLNDEEGFCVAENSIVKKYSTLLKRQNVSFIKFCNTIIPAMEKLQKKNECEDLAVLWMTFESLHSNAEMKDNQSALAYQLGIDIKNDQNNPPLFFFYRLCLRHHWSHQTLMDEAYLVMLTNLIKVSQVSISEIDACIENVIEVVKETLNHKIIDNIELGLQNLPEDENLADFYRDFWKRIFKLNQISALLPIIHQIEMRIQHCRKNPTNLIERALALRDILNLLGRTMCSMTGILKETMINIRPSLLVEEEKHSALLKVDQDVQDFNSMQQEVIVAAVEGIKALIGRCFKQMEYYDQIEDAKTAKTFELQSLKARKTGEELIKSQNTSAKKKQGKKRVNKPLPTRVNEVKSQPKQPQKSMPFPNSNPIDFTQKTMMAEVKKVQLKQITPKNQAETIFENLPDTAVSLMQCEIYLNDLKKSKFADEDCWQQKELQNLEFFIESLLETQGKGEFSVDLIFEQTDLLRRSIETILGVATIFTKISHEEIKFIGHDTEELLWILIKNTSVPENIRKLLWNIRNVAISLADANRCVNYPAKANVQQDRFGDDGRQLIQYLMEVDREGRTQEINDNLRASLTIQHNHSLKRGAYFMERLLKALLDPSKMVDGELPIEDLQKVPESNFVNSASSSLKGLTESNPFSEILIEENHKILSINSREEALLAIDMALTWIGIRCMAPVEGVFLLQSRTEERNIALRNGAIYLRRLKEKLGPDRNIRPMSTILGQCQLMRRCQKELLIAALYHTDSFVDTQHIVEAHDIRFTNSPCVLMSILRNVSTCSKELPSIGNWMHRAHQILSYPASQGPLEGDFAAAQLQVFIQEVRQASRELRQYSSDETLALGSGKFKTPERRLQERINLVKANETQRIFPGLAAFLHTLKYGLSLPKHKYLKTA